MKTRTATYLAVRIEKSINGGYGLAFIDNKSICVSRGIPGDIVSLVITHKKKKMHFARITQLEQPSPLRQHALCPHAQTCGGCQYQDISYHNQLKLKTMGLTDTLSYTYPKALPYLESIVDCQTREYHRNKMEFAFFKTNNTLQLGLKEQHTFDQLVPISDCRLLSPESNALLTMSAAFFNTQALPLYQTRKQEGCLSHLSIRHSKATNTLMVSIVAATPHPCFAEYARTIQDHFPTVSSVNHIHIHQQKGTPSHSTCIHLAGDTHLIETIGTLRFAISPLSFFQTNSVQVPVLYDVVKAHCALDASDTLLDLYCGTGSIGLYVTQEHGTCIGIEENPTAIADARYNAQLNNHTRATFITGRVKNILKFQSFSPDCIVVDPPRSGMVPKALLRVAHLRCKKIVYVSCNPVSLVRDLILFEENGYTVTRFTPVDMFPHTYHLECVVTLTLH